MSKKDIKTIKQKEIIGSFYASCAEQEYTQILGQDKLTKNNQTKIN